MIRYPHAWDDIEDEIGESWLEKAATRTALFKELGKYTEEVIANDGAVTKLAPFWGDIKQVFVDRQHGKCIYCETMLEWGDKANIQWDLEHFRPKRNVRKWPPAKSPLAEKYSDVFTGANAPGYHLLAYNYRNYAASCKTCNSPYKSDYFPIAGQRIQSGSDLVEYAGEEAFLVHPLGEEDADPQDLITFDGVTAVPKYDEPQDPAKWRRGQIIIDFFDLNRDGLQRSRAHWLYWSVWSQVKNAADGDPEARENLRPAQTEYAPYASCATCFITLCQADPESARLKVAVFKKTLELSS